MIGGMFQRLGVILMILDQISDIFYITQSKFGSTALYWLVFSFILAQPLAITILIISIEDNRGYTSYANQLKDKMSQRWERIFVEIPLVAVAVWPIFMIAVYILLTFHIIIIWSKLSFSPGFQRRYFAGEQDVRIQKLFIWVHCLQMSLEDLPQLIIQGINNSWTDSWSQTINIISYVLAFASIIYGSYKVVFKYTDYAKVEGDSNDEE